MIDFSGTFFIAMLDRNVVEPQYNDFLSPLILSCHRSISAYQKLESTGGLEEYDTVIFLAEVMCFDGIDPAQIMSRCNSCI